MGTCATRASHVVVAGALSGLLGALALPPFHLWPLAFVALSPLARALGDPGVSRPEAARAGIAFGAVFYGVLLHWVPFTLHGMVPLGALTGALGLVLLAGIAGAKGVALHWLLSTRGAPAVAALPLVWGGTELAFQHAGPLALPWLPLALALTAVPELGGFAELGGSIAVTLWIAGVNGALAGANRGGLGGAPRDGSVLPGDAPVLRWDARAAVGSRASVRVGVALLLLGPALWGILRARSLPLVPLPAMEAMQLDLPREVLLDPARRDRIGMEGIERLLRGIEVGGVGGLLLLPEAPLASPWGEALSARFAQAAAETGRTLIVGAHLPPGPGGSPGSRNAVLRVGPDGSEGVVHEKRRLVPGVEFPGLAAGPGRGNVEAGGVRAGLLICFEAAFPSEARQLRRDGAELLLNPSNDGWFRPRWRGKWSAAHAQHRAHLVLRAVETRMGAVRASVGGELLLVDPVGRVVLSSPPGEEGVFLLSPTSFQGLTLFVRVGNLGGAALLLLLGGACYFGPGRRIPKGPKISRSGSG